MQSNEPHAPTGIVDEFSDLIDDARRMLQRASNEGGDQAGELRSHVEMKLLTAKLRLQELRGEALDGARRAAGAADAFVQERPWPAIGAAFVAGVLFGLLAGRR